MPTRDRRSALNSSMKAEEEAIKSRFERAETALARNELPSEHHGSTENGQAKQAAVPPHLVTTTQDAPLERVIEEEPRVKRDSFTMPLADYERIADLQKKCLKVQTRASKSEILRAGLMVLSAMNEDDLAQVIDELPKVKTGRPPVRAAETTE